MYQEYVTERVGQKYLSFGISQEKLSLPILAPDSSS